MEETIGLNSPGERVLLSGNEALARGALEAGVSFVTSYPGSPTAEVPEKLAAVSEKFNIYSEWSVNEKVAMEAAAAAAFAGVRSLTIMKCDGLNVAFDFLTSLSPTGVKAGMVIMVGDDPGAHSSAKEEDSRFLARSAHVPVLEPANIGEAPEVMKQAFQLSEELGHPVILRAVTRICHASGTVVLGELNRMQPRASLNPEDRFITWIERHRRQEEILSEAAAWTEVNPLNTYRGPQKPRILIIAAGPSYHYALEAVERMKLQQTVGVQKLVTVWPLPKNLLLSRLKAAENVIFAEEIEPFLEEQIQALAAREQFKIGKVEFFGKLSPDWVGSTGIALGETDPDVIMKALAHVSGRKLDKQQPTDQMEISKRELAFCPGCPHRASYWAVKSALELDGRKGIVLGDIGCYTLGKGSTGFSVLSTLHCMGAGVGLAGGLSQLGRFGFQQPVVAMVGDSTFYHAVIPALVNARYHGSNFLCIVLDNSTTAMTGHQPHPGIERPSGSGRHLSLEEAVEGLGLPCKIADPYQVEAARNLIFDLLQQEGPRVLILRRSCVLINRRDDQKKVWVDSRRCIGEDCGCSRFCSRVFACPANIYDEETGKARIDRLLCTGCGVCADLCPQQAIIVEGDEHHAAK